MTNVRVLTNIHILWLLALTGCGLDVVSATARGDGGLSGDGPPPPGLSVQVTAPNGGSFYQTETVTVSWVPHNDVPGVIRCDAEVRGATTEVIATAASTASDQNTTASWIPAAVPIGAYRIFVTCGDEMGSTASDESNDFTITPPPRDVSFAGELQPLLAAGCTAANCHDQTQPQLGLNLTTGVARGDMVGVSSTQCGAIQLVKPGSPNDSYLIDKLVGSNPGGCYIGVRMPKLASAFSTAQIQAFRDWIANGAPDN